MKRLSLLLIVYLFITSCEQNTGISEQEFFKIMDNVAKGWSTQNTDLALSSFSEDAIYMEPPNTQYYQGHKQLRPYFDALSSEHQMKFHNLWFNPKTQSGAGEFTFSYGKKNADTGIAVVEIQNGKIQFWREYHKKGPSNFEQYIKTENKEWEWHIGNYPETKDSIPLK